MIELKVVVQDSEAEGVQNQFIVNADEPITIEVLNTKKGHTLAHVYRGENPTEFDEPVGAFDSEVPSHDWKVE